MKMIKSFTEFNKKALNELEERALVIEREGKPLGNSRIDGHAIYVWNGDPWKICKHTGETVKIERVAKLEDKYAWMKEYSEYLSENVDRTIAYSDYLSENVDRTIAYSEYVAEAVGKNLSTFDLVSSPGFESSTLDRDFPSFESFMKRHKGLHLEVHDN